MLPHLLTGVLAAGLGYALFTLAGRDPRTALPASRRLPLSVLAGLLAGAGSAVNGQPWNGPLLAVLAAFGVLLGAIDLRSALLPDAVLLRFTAVSVPLLLVAAAGTGRWSGLAGAAAGGATLCAVYLLLALISAGGLGMGDVKLAAVLGLFGGWGGSAAWLGTLLGGFLLGGVVGLAVLLLRRGSRGSTFPFGPGMLLAAFASLALLG
ncbi:prepilin peptidase [Arthrobacter agilis]|uniref:prepilin peptidase n=1 Tax=Arthrobacter agilis TaxID=37921 RepID=UPI0027803C89|nr:prepilin peptidase [Arthrobacter agilis]MDQ0735773.1 leader peptidase (prepilin peptidase)/N-methyltransferase [Arthrobacter agilis]